MVFSPLSPSASLKDRYVFAYSPTSVTPSNRIIPNTIPQGNFSTLVKRMRPAISSQIPCTAPQSGLSTPSSLSPLLVANHYLRNRAGLLSSFPTARLFSTSPPPVTTTTTTTAPVRLPVSFRNYPFRYALTFVAIHPAIAWGLMTPIYLVCHYTSITTLLLAGPSGAAVLSTRIPSYVPARALYGLQESRAKHDLSHEGGDPTVEEWLEMAVRKSAASSWKLAKGLRRAILSVKGASGGEDVDSETSSSSGFSWSKLKRAQQVASDLQSQGLEGLKGTEGEKISWWRGYVKNQAEEIRFRQVADGVAAYILIKALLPIRIPLSLWLTPKIVKKFL